MANFSGAPNVLSGGFPAPGSANFGNVDGPATSTDNAIATWNGTSGTALRNSVVTVSATGIITKPGTGIPLITTNSALDNGAAAATGTLTNAPAVGNPTKWIPINDNGTTRYIPAW